MTIRNFFCLTLFLFLTFLLVEAEPVLDAKLAPLEPLPNKEWTGMMKAPDGSALWKTMCKYEVIWDGNVIKSSRATPEMNSFEEGFIYWDDIAKKPAFFSIHSKGVYRSGFVSMDKNVITFEGKMTWPAPPPNPSIKQSYDFRNTFELKSESEMVDSWFQNAFGPWRPGHVIHFQAQREDHKTGEQAYPVLFYSGRGDNKDVYILHPGDKEPRNLTNHPAQDLCPAASPDGKRIAFLSDREGNMEIFSMNIDGSALCRLTTSPEAEMHPEFSPDGKQIVFIKDFEKKTEIWIMDADGTNPRRLTQNEARDERPFISPDGSKIVFMSNRDGNYEIYTMAADGSQQTRITNTPEWEIFPAWSPDGREIGYSRKFKADGRMQGMIRIMNADGSNDREITKVETRDENSMWSPDGRFIIFQSVRDGNFEVYQVKRDGSDPVRLTNDPAWDGWASYVPSRMRE